MTKEVFPMTPSRLAFVQEFEQQLTSDPITQWFDTARRHEPSLEGFAHPASLRQFLHLPKRVSSEKPEIWRALVRSLQLDRTPGAVVFVLGLLEPALGRLADGLEVTGLDVDDLWQETVACALKALANPRLPRRDAVLAGLVWDTFKHLCPWLENNLDHIQRAAPLLEAPYEPDFEQRPEWHDEEAVLGEWGPRAGVAQGAIELIVATRLNGKHLSQLAPSRTPAYDRLRRLRTGGERKLEAWLSRTASFAR
jgi:hypothetical protein